MQRLSLARLTIAAAALLAALPTAAGTMQQDFDAAQALLDGGKAAAARDAFTALLARFSPGSKVRAAFVVRARLGRALVDYGNPDAAVPLLTAAIAGFTAPTPQDREEREGARLDLGRAEELRVNLDTAASHFRAVLASGIFARDEPVDIGLRAGLARTLIWSDPDEARRLLDGLLALPEAKLGNTRDTLALVKELRGRIDLNNGNPLGARKWFEAAAEAAGGAETARINVADVRIRGDLALANYKLKRFDEVQRAVAFSGAGGLADEGLSTAAATPLPACAPVTGLSRDAVAVVEFAIGDDGRVISVTPIYASRGSADAGAAGRDSGPEVLFAQAVRRWYWSADSLAKLKPFWRQSVRVELRCFTEGAGVNPVDSSFSAEDEAWLDSLAVRDTPEWSGTPAAILSDIRRELARRETSDGAESAQLLPVLRRLARNGAAPEADRSAAAERWLRLAGKYQAPLAVVTRFRVVEIDWLTAQQRYPAALAFPSRQLAALLAELQAAGHGDSRAAMLVRLSLGAALERRRSDGEARAIFDAIVAAPPAVVPADDPIRTAALLHISNLAAGARNTAAAAQALAATGLSPDQCSLIDVQPQAINATVTESSFPVAAQRWGTGGYARIGYDITVDGVPTGVRTVVASPPFVFGETTEAAVRRFRYKPVFRPGNVLGCTGNLKTVRFRVVR